ncbi:MAG: hypothetical protein WCP19_09045 [Chloroflexota bacterium]
MTNKDSNYQFLTEAVDQLQGYLLSDELYWPLSGNLPRLTPGSLLLTLEFALVTSPNESAGLQTRINQLRTKWKAAWIKKCEREIQNRLRLWSQYMSETPANSMESYKIQVRGRTIIQLLLTEAARPDNNEALLVLDAKLKKQFIPGIFIWDRVYENSFPPAVFWFLFGTL